MPIPIHGLRARERPGGLVEPSFDLAGVTELRVHGVGGTTPEHLLADQSPEQVAGDTIAGFYRTADLGVVDASDCSTGARTKSRHVEAYSWGGTTSKSASRALWLLLLPFMLANVAGWACSARMKQSPLFAWHQRAMRVVCLALTLNVVLVVSFIAADLCAYQAPRADALGDKWWLWPLRWSVIAGHPGRSLAVGFAAPVLLVVILAKLGQASADKYEKVRPPAREGAGHAPPTKYASEHDVADAEFFDGEHAVRYAMWLHIAAATGFIAILFAGTARAASQTPSHAVVLWWIAVVVGAGVLAAVVALLMFWDRIAERNARVARNLAAGAAAGVISAGIYSCCQGAYTAVQPRLPGFGSAMLWSFGAFLAVVVCLAVLELFTFDSSANARLFPWASPLIILVAFGLLNLVLFSTAFVVAHNLGTVVFTTKDAGTGAFYLSPTLAWITPGLVLALVVALLVFAGLETLRFRTRKLYLENLRMEYEHDTVDWRRQRDAAPEAIQIWMENALREPDERWVKRAVFWRWLEGAPLDAPLLLWFVLVLQALVVAFVLVFRPQLPGGLSSPGSVWMKALILVGTAAPLGLMWLLRDGWKNPSGRKTIGILWDVGTFWPRAYHPLAPPSYAERAVPDLQRRIWWLHDNDGKVVIAAHSQGTMLAATALLQTECRAHDAEGRLADEVALVTFGSPLCKLFHWAFPAYFSPEVLAPLAPGGAAHVKAWRNFHYPTDPVAGPIFPTPNRVDCELRDPITAAYIYGQDPPAVGEHSGYWTDPNMWSEVDQIADEL